MMIPDDNLLTIVGVIVSAAYVDLRLLVVRLHKRVSIWEHCHIKCKPDDSKLFSEEN